MNEELVPQEIIQEEEKEPLQEKPRSKLRLGLAACGGIVLLCAALFVGTLVIAGPKFVQKYIPEKIGLSKILPPLVAQVNTMGDPNAPVHIIEYGDYQCPYCLEFWNESEALLIEEYVNTGKVYFEYRSFGAYLGPESGLAAEGSYCAGDQGKFWEYHNILFTNWTGENVGDFTQDKLSKYAQSLDLNMTEFESCISEGKYKGTVEQDAAQAEADGVHGTPTLFINGVKYEGVLPFHALKYYIDQSLNGNFPQENG